ncbi:MAG: hypothetical protein HQ543_09225 [Bacteroidetes bacterium]|nr:hypothetical protein [Bacteroidota bacterium]
MGSFSDDMSDRFMVFVVNEVLKFLFNESKELASIIAKSVVTAKSKIGINSSQA